MCVDWASGLEVLEMRNLVVSPGCMEAFLVKLGPNLREFRLDCDLRMMDATFAFEALNHLEKVEVLELGLLFDRRLGKGKSNDWLKNFPHSGNLREFIFRAQDGENGSPRFRYEGLASFLDNSPQLETLAISPLSFVLDRNSRLARSLKGLEQLRNLSPDTPEWHLGLGMGTLRIPALAEGLEQLHLLETLKLCLSNSITVSCVQFILSAVFRGCVNLKELDVHVQGANNSRYYGGECHNTEYRYHAWKLDFTKGMFKNCAISLGLIFIFLIRVICIQ